MKAWDKWLFHLSTIMVTATGVAYLWMKYVMEADDPFSVVNHPWQPAMLALHVLSAPVTVFVFGRIVDSHVRKKLKSGSGANRRTGLVSTFALPAMVVSGYALQVVTAEVLARVALITHLASSSAFVLTYVIHQVVSWQLRARKTPDGPDPRKAQSRPNGMTARLCVAACLLCVFPSGLRAGAATGQRVHRNVFLMGTEAVLEVRSANRDSGLAVLEKLVGVLEETEREFSTWQPGSVLSRLNRQPVGRPFPAGAELCALVGELDLWRERTLGTFDPAIGALIDAWDLHGSGRIAQPWELQRARNHSGLAYIHLEGGSRDCTLTRLRDVRIDAGAFGKGAGLDRVRRFAASSNLQEGSWMIDLGGQIAVGGIREDEEGWEISLADPRQRRRGVRTLRLRSGSLATSGGSEGDIEVGSRRVGHILDPRTGQTVVFDGSAVVWHESALVADILSTALYVMGVRAGLEWADANSVAAAFLIPKNGSVEFVTSNRFKTMFPGLR